MTRALVSAAALALVSTGALADGPYVALGGGWSNGFTIDNPESGREFEAEFEGGLKAAAGVGWRKTTARGSGLRIELSGSYIVDGFELDEVTRNGSSATAVDLFSNASLGGFDPSLAGLADEVAGTTEAARVFDGSVEGWDVGVMAYYDWPISRNVRPYFGAGAGYGVYDIEATSIFIDTVVADPATENNCALGGVSALCLAGVAFDQEVDSFLVRAVVGAEFVVMQTAAIFVEARYEAVVGGDADAAIISGGATQTSNIDLGLSAPAAYAGVRLFF